MLSLSQMKPNDWSWGKEARGCCFYSGVSKNRITWLQKKSLLIVCVYRAHDWFNDGDHLHCNDVGWVSGTCVTLNVTVCFCSLWPLSPGNAVGYSKTACVVCLGMYVRVNYWCSVNPIWLLAGAPCGVCCVCVCVFACVWDAVREEEGAVL